MTDKRNKTWVANDVIIKEAFAKYIEENTRSPTIRELANICKLNYNTVVKHLKVMSFESDIKPKHRFLTDQVILGLGKQAMKGKAAEVKLWMQIVEGMVFKEGREVEDKGLMSIAELMRKAVSEEEKISEDNIE